MGNYSLINTTPTAEPRSATTEIKVLGIISLVIAAASTLGIIVILCPCGYKRPSSIQSRRYLVQSSSVRRVTKCLTIAGVLGNIGIYVTYIRKDTAFTNVIVFDYSV